MPGYSGTPLPKKLGIKAGFRVTLVDAPSDVRSDLSAPLATCKIVTDGKTPLDFAMVFNKVQASSRKRIPTNDQEACALWNAVGKLAEEKFRRGH